MQAPPLIVALEGPCCAGKTTLGRALATSLAVDHRLTYVADYSDWAGGGRFLPSPEPGSLADEERALRRFIELEADRTAHARTARRRLDLILIDRSVHSLLAHCAALTTRAGLNYTAVADQIVGESTVAMWPDVILYIDVDEATVAARNPGKFAPDSLFLDPAFNRSIRHYFRSLHRVSQRRVTWLDGTADARLLHLHARAHLTEALTTPADGRARR